MGNYEYEEILTNLRKIPIFSISRDARNELIIYVGSDLSRGSIRFKIDSDCVNNTYD